MFSRALLSFAFSLSLSLPLSVLFLRDAVYWRSDAFYRALPSLLKPDLGVFCLFSSKIKTCIKIVSILRALPSGVYDGTMLVHPSSRAYGGWRLVWE